MSTIDNNKRSEVIPVSPVELSDTQLDLITGGARPQLSLGMDGVAPKVNPWWPPGVKPFCDARCQASLRALDKPEPNPWYWWK